MPNRRSAQHRRWRGAVEVGARGAAIGRKSVEPQCYSGSKSAAVTPSA